MGYHHMFVPVPSAVLCIGGTFNQDDRQTAIVPAIYPPCQEAAYSSASSLSSTPHIHTFILLFSFSECQLIFSSLSIQGVPHRLTHTYTHIQYRSLLPSLDCAAASVVKGLT